MPRFVVALAALVLLPAVAGCVIEGPPPVQEGAHREAPIQGEGRWPLDAKGFDVFWRNPESGEEKPYQWAATSALHENGTFTIVSDHFTLTYRVDEFLPVKLRYDADLSTQNSFNFTYREPATAMNRTVTRVVDVDPESHLDVRANDRVSGDVAGDFVIKFSGTCDEGDAGCAAPGEPQIVLMKGKFPWRTH